MIPTLGTRAPMRMPISGSVDSSGTGTVAQPSTAQTWSKVRVAAQLSSGVSANWTIMIGRSNTSGDPVDFFVGGSIKSTYYMLGPGEYLILGITNADPNATVSGTIIGMQGVNPSLEDISDSGSGNGLAFAGTVDASITGNVPVVNATDTLLATNQPQSLLAGPLAVPNDGTDHTYGPYTLPTATHAVMVAWAPGGSGGPTYINLVGNNSGIDWASYPPVIINNRLSFEISDVIDSAVTVGLEFPSGSGTTDVWVVAILDTLTVTIDQGQANPIGIVPGENNSSVGGDITSASSGALALYTSSRYSYPAPWQAPQHIMEIVSITGGSGTTALVSGISDELVYVWSVYVLITSTGATAPLLIEDSNGVGIGRIPSGWPENSVWLGQYQGAPVPSGVGYGLQANSASGGASALIGLTYSQQ